VSKKPNVVFLYSEVAGYFMASVKALAKKANVLIVRWEINKEAPFEIELPAGVEMVVKSDLEMNELYQKVHDFKPDLIVCSGWRDGDYVKIVKSFKRTIPTVLAFDNHWTGSLKQRLLCVVSRFTLKTIFTNVWVAGEPQKIYAKKLGFKKIEVGYYCADVNLFDRIYKNQNQAFKKQFLYVGRYVKYKGVFEMWQAFIELQNENPNDWKMLCIGTGDEWENRLEHPKIKHVGFVQPSDMEGYLNQKSVYVLPSKFEPWGVTVQEFAITSCPLVLSDRVGASTKYLIHNENGILINDVTVEALKTALKKMMSKSDTELLEMSQKSHQLGMSYTNEMWTETIMNLAD